MDREYFERTTCNLCGADDYKMIYSDQNYRSKLSNLAEISTYLCTDINKGDFGKIVKCNRCGLVYANPRIKSEISRNLYMQSVDNSYVQERDQRIKSFARVARECEELKKGGSLLDIGCLCGFFLEAIAKDKWECFGIEISKWGVDYIKKHFGFKVFNGDLYEANYPSKYFDLVTMWDVVEHLYNPKQVLIEINRVLKDEGILCFVVPNINSLAARLFRHRWWFLLQSHIYYFTPQTIKEMLHKTGFRIIKIDTYGRSFTLSYWATKIEPYSKIIYKLVNDLIENLNINNLSLNINLGDHMKIFAKKII